MTAESLSPENDAIVQTLSPEQQKALEENNLSPSGRQKIIDNMMQTQEGKDFIQKHAYSVAIQGTRYTMDFGDLREKQNAATIASLQDLVISYEKGLGERFSSLSDLSKEELQARNTVYNKLQKQEIHHRGRQTGVGVLEGDEAKQQEAQKLLELVATEKNLSDAQKNAIQNLLGNDKKDLIDQAFLDDVTRTQRQAEKKAEEAATIQEVVRKQAQEANDANQKAREAEKLSRQEERALKQTKEFMKKYSAKIKSMADRLTSDRLKELLTSLQDPDTATTAQVKKLQQALGTRADGSTSLMVDGSFGARTYASLEKKVSKPDTLAALEEKLSK